MHELHVAPVDKLQKMYSMNYFQCSHVYDKPVGTYIFRYHHKTVDYLIADISNYDNRTW